jgi:hypothetical protein
VAHACRQIPYEDDEEVGADFAGCKAALDALSAAQRRPGLPLRR